MIACAANLCSVTDPEPPETKHARNQNWRDWNVTKNKAVRISEGKWAEYDIVCQAEGTDRTKDINAHIDRRIRAFRRHHPEVQFPTDATGDAD